MASLRFKGLEGSISITLIVLLYYLYHRVMLLSKKAGSAMEMSALSEFGYLFMHKKATSEVQATWVITVRIDISPKGVEISKCLPSAF